MTSPSFWPSPDQDESSARPDDSESLGWQSLQATTDSGLICTCKELQIENAAVDSSMIEVNRSVGKDPGKEVFER